MPGDGLGLLRGAGAALLGVAMVIAASAGVGAQPVKAPPGNTPPGEAKAPAAECAYRGDLDAVYCDLDRDMIADAPISAHEIKDPRRLVFGFPPIDRPDVFERLFADFRKSLSESTKRPVLHFAAKSHASTIISMRAGRLQLGAFATGTVGFAVNLSGFVPVAALGGPDGILGYTLNVVVPADSEARGLGDLKGRIIAHSVKGAIAGDLLARALLPGAGLTPGDDYQVTYSGGFDRSVIGAGAADYAAALVPSHVLERMVKSGGIAVDDFRVLWRSPKVPTRAFGYSHDLAPYLIDAILGALQRYRVPKEYRAALGGADRFYPISYAADWAVVRALAKSTGTKYDADGLESLAKREIAKMQTAKGRPEPAPAPAPVPKPKPDPDPAGADDKSPSLDLPLGPEPEGPPFKEDLPPAGADEEIPSIEQEMPPRGEPDKPSPGIPAAPSSEDAPRLPDIEVEIDPAAAGRARPKPGAATPGAATPGAATPGARRPLPDIEVKIDPNPQAGPAGGLDLDLETELKKPGG